MRREVVYDCHLGEELVIHEPVDSREGPQPAQHRLVAPGEPASRL